MKISCRSQAVRIVTLLLVACFAGGWGPVAHFQATSVPERNFANLPDIYASNEWIVTPSGKEVTAYFGWTHGTRINGLVELVPGAWYPVTPSVYNTPPGTELPETDMYFLVKHKLSASHVDPDMIFTARGFLVHNVEDSVVHFAFFRGASVNDWVTEHLLKEQWAEFVIYYLVSGIDYIKEA